MTVVSTISSKCLFSSQDAPSILNEGIPLKIELILSAPHSKIASTIKKVDRILNRIFVLSEIKRASSSSLAITSFGTISDHVYVNIPFDIGVRNLEINHYVMNHFWSSENSHAHKILDKKEYEIILASEITMLN